MKFNKYVYWTLVVLILLTGLYFVSRYFRPITSNWKTYSKNGLEFSYPDNLVLSDSPGLDSYGKSLLANVILKTKDYTEEGNEVATSVIKGYEYTITLENNKCQKSPAIKFRDRIINKKYVAQMGYFDPEKPGEEELALIDPNGQCLTFGGTYSPENKTIWLSNFNQILNTIKLPN